ncbi:thioredoxin, putative [Entamoeba histolytica HM-1:IMSS-B]|uniref:Thioredoxin, putative n=5 Tax=Entamoeba histolytica TaxID=5759 RepID=C4LU31_ENTH1|nr:thioredoxin, putative [Entamoeba histolytica HM-1:IMSS]EMH74488.1 thioredoxin, putative [Entamoeba histolytica HM-1:IMSS-B]EMS16309.1 thioredoxin, putative [Entamoeba histolytica HM-3:IMSS]ENY61698.1 thioredoxin, putative [Entamoeba histolytica HM-1:IMSS-A]GAT92100.1 thioredoxin putative [Entamoeba histolytica]EAL48762.1 thioredoxin, putative [Entamoeba histolytica HM-1:IMSS]|eukprot:XP_654151.1 thioredoxin, putative [Entamoeba histolytica HM-1:IMSS]
MLLFFIPFILFFSLSSAYIWEFDPNKLQRQLTQNKTVLLLHYIPYGETYKNYKSTFSQLDEAIQKQQNKNIIVGQIDCEEYEDYCENNQITHYPSFTILQPNDQTIFINSLETKKIQEALHTIGIEIEDIKPIHIITFTFENSTEIAKEPTLVKFFVPWCGHCNSLKPIWENISRESKLRIGEVNCDKESRLCSIYSISHYPTIIYITKDQNNNEVREVYEGERTFKDLKTFIEQKNNSKKQEL